MGYGGGLLNQCENSSRRGTGGSSPNSLLVPTPSSPSPSPQPVTGEGRAQYLAWLAFGSPEEFADPRLAYRRLFSEVLGTFFLVLVGRRRRGPVRRAPGQPRRGRRRPRADGPGDHPVHGRGVGRASESRRVGGVCDAGRFPVEAGTGVRARAACSERPSRACSWSPCLATSSTSARPCPARDTRTGRRS